MFIFFLMEGMLTCSLCLDISPLCFSSMEINIQWNCLLFQKHVLPTSLFLSSMDWVKATHAHHRWTCPHVFNLIIVIISIGFYPGCADTMKGWQNNYLILLWILAIFFSTFLAFSSFRALWWYWNGELQNHTTITLVVWGIVDWTITYSGHYFCGCRRHRKYLWHIENRLYFLTHKLAVSLAVVTWSDTLVYIETVDFSLWISKCLCSSPKRNTCYVPSSLSVQVALVNMNSLTSSIARNLPT